MTPVAVVLSGGIGKRFSPFVTNKTIFPFMGKPFLAYVLEDLASWGLSEAIVVTNPSNHDAIAQLVIPGLHIQLVIQPQPTGMAGALAVAKPLIAGRSILIRNATSLVGPEIGAQITPLFLQSQSFLTAVEDPTHTQGGYVQLLGDQPIGILEKPDPSKKAGHLRVSGLYYCADSKALFDELDNVSVAADDAYEQALTRLLKHSHFNLVRYTGYKTTLKSAHHVLSTMEALLAHRLLPPNPEAASHPSAVIEGPVYIDKEAKIMAGAVIVGPTYIGPGVVIGTHTLVRSSMIEAGSEVGYGSEIARSYIGPRCRLHNVYVGDSVLESEVDMGAGAKTANLRLDNQPIGDSGRRKLGALMAKGVKVGINASLMPGLRIGAKSLIGPATLVSSDLPSGAKCYTPSQSVVK